MIREENEEFFEMFANRISSGRPILVQDIGLTEGQTEELGMGGSYNVYDARELTKSLIELLGSAEDGPSTAILFVGRSGEIVRQYLRATSYENGVRVHATTVDRSGSIPVVTTSALSWHSLIDLNIRKVIVFDDVVSSGKTLELLAERNAWRFPRATWYAAVWITRKEKLKGYKCVFASLQASHPKGKRVPINSLSTLIAEPAIAEVLVENHFPAKEAEVLLRMFEMYRKEKEIATCPG
jgi:hypothetical protein